MKIFSEKNFTFKSNLFSWEEPKFTKIDLGKKISLNLSYCNKFIKEKE